MVLFVVVLEDQPYLLLPNRLPLSRLAVLKMLMMMSDRLSDLVIHSRASAIEDQFGAPPRPLPAGAPSPARQAPQAPVPQKP